MRQYDAVVVGAGISGLLSALMLSRHGKKVCVLERGEVGGVFRSYDVCGDSGTYRVDTGPHIITRLARGPFRTLYDSYIENHIEFVPHGDYYVRFCGRVEKFPWALKDFCLYDALPIRDRLLLLSSLLRLKSTRGDVSVQKFFSPYRLSPRTERFIDAFSYFLTGLPARETPVERLKDSQRHKDDASSRMARMGRTLFSGRVPDQYYPRGGIQTITDGVLAGFGGEIFAGDAFEVESISDDGTCVRTRDEEFHCDFVVYSAPVRLLPDLLALPCEFAETARNLRAVSSLSMWVGFKGRPFSRMGSEVWIDTHRYCWAVPISNYDPSLAPPGCQLVGFAFIGASEKEALKTIFEVFPDASLDMVHFQHLTPEKAAWSLSPFPGTESPVRNVYLVGTDTEKRSMGLTRASYSVLNLKGVLAREGRL